jgi:hypothetical protein
MSKVLIGVLALLFVIAMIPVTVIALSAPSSPPAMASMAGPLSRVNFEDVPTPQRFQARDGARLQYYAYPAAQDKVTVLIHGSVGPGKVQGSRPMVWRRLGPANTEALRVLFVNFASLGCSRTKGSLAA